MISCTGWAVVDGGEIKVRTVTDTRRAAVLNWLCTEKRLVALMTATDELIEQTWQRQRGDAFAAQVAIHICS